jgi:hypothetical protein
MRNGNPISLAPFPYMNEIYRDIYNFFHLGVLIPPLRSQKSEDSRYLSLIEFQNQCFCLANFVFARMKAAFPSLQE